MLSTANIVVTTVSRIVWNIMNTLQELVRSPVKHLKEVVVSQVIQTAFARDLEVVNAHHLLQAMIAVSKTATMTAMPMDPAVSNFPLPGASVKRATKVSIYFLDQ